MIDAVAPPTPLIIVEEARSHQPAILLGFMAVGAEGDMVRLETRAGQLQLPASRAKNDKDQAEVMIMFPPGSDQKAGLQLYRDTLDGKLGALKLEVIVITKERAADGIDIDKDATAEDPSFIEVPSR